MSCILPKEKSVKMPYLENTKCSYTSFRFMHFFTAGFLNTTYNQPVDRLTQSRLLISLLLLVNNHLELQNRSSKAEKAGGVLSSTLGALSPGFKFLDANITLRSSAAKSSFIW